MRHRYARCRSWSKNFGKDHAQAVWDAQLAAIDTIDRIVWREQIKCQFDWVPAYLFNPRPSTAEQRTTRSICRRKPTWRPSWGSTPSSSSARRWSTGQRVRFDNQAKFHPRKYLVALLRLLCAGKGCQVYEQTEVDEIEGTPITATTANGVRIHCEHVLIATHVPLQGKSGLLPATVLQSKLAPYSSVRRRRLGAARHGSRSALLGHRRSVRLRARRSPARPRLRDLRRRRSQDRPGGRDRRSASAASSSGSSAAAGDCRHASMVRAGHRDQRRPAVHRRDRRAAVRRDRIRAATA